MSSTSEDRRTSRRRVPLYDDEDTTLTTERELMGWYSYGLAAEVFAVCGVGAHCDHEHKPSKY